MGFMSPRDPRWQGPARWYLYFDLIKNIVLAAFVILVIVENVLYRRSYMFYHTTAEYDSSETAALFFIRIGMALLPDVISVILTHTLLHYNHYHPVYALTQALVIFCVYPSAIAFNLIVVYSDETGAWYVDSWQRLCWAEMGLQAVLMVLWIGLVVCSCIAVHKWRGIKAKGVLREVIKEELELKSVGGRRDGKDVDVERDGQVESSGKSSETFVL